MLFVDILMYGILYGSLVLGPIFILGLILYWLAEFINFLKWRKVEEPKQCRRR